MGNEPRAERSRWSKADTYALLAILLIASLLRFWNLGHPNELVFDETYYAKDACWYVLHDASVCQRDATSPEVHPPLGKWLIAIGVRITGFDCPAPEDACEGSTTAGGWRIVPAIAGIATVLLLYLLARRLLASTLAASIASGLLALDFLHLVQSRTSMLDIFVPLFGVAGFLFLVYDRDRIAAGISDAGARSMLDRPWRLAAGLAFGAAAATKWSGIWFVLAGIVLTVVWEAAGRRRAGVKAWPYRLLAEESASIVLYLAIVPVAFYLFTYIGRLGGDVFALPWTEGSWWRGLWDHHRYMLDFHANLDSQHSYQSPPWTWLALKRPVSYYFCSSDCSPSSGGDYQEIFAAGSPFVWWTSAIALLYVAWNWIRRRSLTAPEGVILGGFFFTYAPWLISDAITHRPAVFLFYLVPTIPFMCLALAYVVTKIGSSWEARAAIALFSVIAIGFFVFYHPLLVGSSLPSADWDDRIWVFDNCDKPPGDPTTTTITETLDGSVTTRAVETTVDSGGPPTGWCWI